MDLKRKQAGVRKRGKRWKLGATETFVKVFKINEYSARRRPMTQPLDDDELVAFLSDEMQQPYRVVYLKQQRANFNAGRLTQGNVPNVVSKCWSS